jgi:DNA-binding transcriptional ArsR family regulator
MMWLDNIDIKSLGDRTRVLILQRLRERLGYVGAYRALGISDSSLSRYLRAERRIPDEVVRRALQNLGDGRLFRLSLLFVVLKFIGLFSSLSL